MNIWTGADLGDIIMDVKFKFEEKKFRDFDVIVGQISPFSVDFARERYHAACDKILSSHDTHFRHHVTD